MFFRDNDRTYQYFYPRPPRGGRLPRDTTLKHANDFYPRPPRGGRPLFWEQELSGISISIHALREEGDPGYTLHYCEPIITDFYPRPPRGGRLLFELHHHGGQTISIHALREEGDEATKPKPFFLKEFLSTPSARRATRMP